MLVPVTSYLSKGNAFFTDTVATSNALTIVAAARSFPSALPRP